MTEPLLTFRRFNDPAQASQLAATLAENGISNQLEDASPSFDVTYANSLLAKEYLVKIQQKDFAAAQDLLNEQAAAVAATIGTDHYLFQFTDEELADVVSKPDEWNETDLVLAQQLLGERGIVPDLEQIKKERIRLLSKPERSPAGWIVIAYLFMLAGGVGGVFIGWYMVTSKKTLPDGTSVYAFKDRDRRHGQVLFAGGTLIILVMIVLRVGGYFEND